MSAVVIGTYHIARHSPDHCFRALATPLTSLKGIGPLRAAQLAAQGLGTIEDLLYCLPFRYEDRRSIRKIADLTIGERQSSVGRIQTVRTQSRGWRKSVLEARFSDGNEEMNLLWFNPKPYMLGRLCVGQRLLVYGRVEPGKWGGKQITHPEFEFLDDDHPCPLPRIIPIYRRLGGIPTSTLRHCITEALERFGHLLPSFFPEPITQRQRLLDLGQALRHLHLPPSSADLDALNSGLSRAHRSVIFDELFYFQLSLACRRRSRQKVQGFCFSPQPPGALQRMLRLLPFALTRAQEDVLREIHQDMAGPRPMQRLLQGDVGSGKTMVAWLAALRAVENGCQAVLLAPTELLAEQHYAQIEPYGRRIDVSVGLLVGGLSAAVKRATLARINRGEIDFIVGTHALLQEKVVVPKMGLGIVDEQHRFGVRQRAQFTRLGSLTGQVPGKMPHMLFLSATPIPRSLAMLVYGDMDVSFLDQLPPGRTPVRTLVVDRSRRRRVYEGVRREIEKGHQAYIVLPLVQESPKLHVHSATATLRELSNSVFKGLRSDLIHGQMSMEEREGAMRRFKEGDSQILVTTTVIEVGIDVARATIMVIEHAERFGLAQLHQLRGRVGRGRDASFCVLIHYGTHTAESKQRLEVIARSSDGFEVAEADLKLRGPGELLGTRQSGFQDFRLADPVRDNRLLAEARREAESCISELGESGNPDFPPLLAVAQHRWAERSGPLGRNNI